MHYKYHDYSEEHVLLLVKKHNRQEIARIFSQKRTARQAQYRHDGTEQNLQAWLDYIRFSIEK